VRRPGRHARPRRRAGRPRRGRRGHGDGQVPEDARGTPWPAGEQHDAVARVDEPLVEVQRPRDRAHRGVADGDATPRTGSAGLAYLRRSDVRDLRAG